MKTNLWIIYIGLIFLSLASCSVTKHLPEDEVLYTGIRKIVIMDRDSTPEGDVTLEEVEAALSYPPNNALLGSSSVRIPFPFGLWMYNALVNKKGKVGQWLFRKLAAKPVYITNVNPDVRIKVADNLLEEYGYFNGKTSYTLVPNPKDPKQAKIDYQISMKDPYTYDSIQYAQRRHRTDTIVMANATRSLLKKGDNFSVTVLEAERQRISTLLRNNGYYYFRPEYITYQADTVRTPGKVSLKVVSSNNVPREALRPWSIGNITVALNGYNNEPPTDTLLYKDLTILYEGKLRVRPAVLYRKLTFKPGERYSNTKQMETQTALSRLGIFKYAEMQYMPQDTTCRCKTLDLRINTAYDLPLDGELEFNVTTKSNDQTGPGAIFSMTKRNVFGGGESWGVQLKGSYEWQTGADHSSLMNSYEYGISTSLVFPRVVFPRMGDREYDFPATTTFRLYADQMNRAKYYKLLAFGGNATYNFQPKPTSKHSLTPFRLTFNVLRDPTQAFLDLQAENPALYVSLRDQFIPAMEYTYTYDNLSQRKNRRSSHWWQTTLTSAGNLTSCIYRLAGQPFNKQEKQLLGVPFAQFAKLNSEFRYNYRIDRNQSLAARVAAGCVWSYGNMLSAPYTEQFYIGGANSVRAFAARSIGPGGYAPANAETDKYGFINHVGDIRLEANVEYRFHLIADLHGAVFLDAGNVWLLRPDAGRPDGAFTLKKFPEQIALGTGLGLRYDLDFLVFRLDCGVGLHDPSKLYRNGYYNIGKFKDGLALHFAIGYPF